MMKYYRVLFCIIIIFFYENAKSINVNIQDSLCCSYYDSVLKIRIFYQVDEPPEFIGGSNLIREFIFKNIKEFESIELYEENYLKFYIVIDQYGKVIKSGIVDKKDKELNLFEIDVLRVLNLLPDWIPGKCQGMIVPVRVEERFRLIPAR